jgi:hypothetical protein
MIFLQLKIIAFGQFACPCIYIHASKIYPKASKQPYLIEKQAPGGGFLFQSEAENFF